MRRAAAMMVALLLALGAGGLGHAARAQSDAQGLALEVEDTEAFPSVTLAVTLPVAMLSENGGAPDFSVTENGEDVEVVSAETESFTREPLDVVLLIDTSGSMAGEPLADAKAAARGFLEAIEPEDRVALVSFAFKPAVVAPFTADRAEVLSAIDGLSAAGETAVHDAVVTAAGIARSSERRVAMVLLSDGGDTVSINSFDSAVSSVKDIGAPVFTVALESGEWDPAALDMLSTATGGRALSTADSGELPALYAGIARELGNRFRVTFTSRIPNTKDLEIGVRATRGQLSATGSLALP
ncbi:MAG: VWA domain-containing protein, partial [Actinomycetota bacterium]|nr:VWA domain-containing protein [Actinomycetota bacterium]